MSVESPMLHCLIGGCNNAATCRGLCHSCYQQALKKIAKGETTWGQLEALGLCRSPRGRQGAFSAAFAQTRQVRSLPGQMVMFKEGGDEVPNS